MSSHLSQLYHQNNLLKTFNSLRGGILLSFHPQFMANPDKRWAFKVSIHCEGCKRKVHKIIQNIEGVEKVDIDLKQHKVSVHGNVDPQTVIWKLEKSGKHAEVWPQKEKPVNKDSKRPGKDKSRDKQSSSQEEDRDQSVQENSKGEEKSAVKGEVVQKPTVVENRADAAEKETPGGGQSSTDANGGDANTNCTIGKIDDGNGRHKKKNKGQNGKKETSECDEAEKDVAAGCTVPGGPDPNNGRTNQGLPRHRRAQRPEHTAHSHGPCYAPPPQVFPAHNYGDYDYRPPPPLPPRHYYGPPVYAVNHHTAHPASSHSASQFYAPQPPINSYHAYMHPIPEDRRPYYDPYHHQWPSESFQFSNENPNACLLM